MLDVAQAVFTHTDKITAGHLVKLSITDSAHINRGTLSMVIKSSRLTLQDVSFDKTHLPFVEIFETEPYIIQNFTMKNVFIDRSDEDMCFYPLSPTYMEFIYVCSKLPNLVSAKISPNKYKHESKFKNLNFAVQVWNEITHFDLANKYIDVCFGNDERQKECFINWTSK